MFEKEFEFMEENNFIRLVKSLQWFFFSKEPIKVLFWRKNGY